MRLRNHSDDAVAAGAGAQNQASRFVIERNDRTIVLEPYADNIIRVTLSAAKSAALEAPGYGIVGTASMTGWTEELDADGYRRHPLRKIDPPHCSGEPAATHMLSNSTK